MDCCDICGDIGVASSLHTCRQCEINTEHLYCMRPYREDLVTPIHDWLCEECESRLKTKPLISFVPGDLPVVTKFNSQDVRKGLDLRAQNKKLPNESRVGSGNWEKKVETGKTKYLSVEEALMLSTGEKKPSNFTGHSKATQPKIGTSKPRKTAVRSRIVPISFSSQQDLASGPSQPPKPQRLGNIEIRERQLQQSNKLTEVLRPVSSLQPSQAPENKHMHREQPKEIQWARKKARGLVKQHSSTPSPTPSLNASPVTISGGNGHTAIELRIGDAKNMNDIVLPDIEKCSFAPALNALWKGSFNIQDDHRRGKLNLQIQAHPPSKVRSKVYEFSKNMPEVLRFQLVPAQTFWINLFKEYVPNERDIGLYFFPRVGERLEDYIQLLESISLKNLALREQIADVELLIFTSKVLAVDLQCREGKHYLWGVFHRLKRDTTACLGNRVLELYVPPSCGASHAQNQVANMDIDMIGGTHVGKTDVPVRRKCTSFREESTAAAASPRPNQQIAAVSRPALAPVATVPSSNVKVEPCDLIPPGFEEVFKLRVQGSLSSVVNAGGRKGKERAG